MKADILDDIMKELARAKKAVPNYPDHLMAKAGLIVTKAGNLTGACWQVKYRDGVLRPTGDDKKELRKHAIEVAAQAIRFLENLK